MVEKDVAAFLSILGLCPPPRVPNFIAAQPKIELAQCLTFGSIVAEEQHWQLPPNLPTLREPQVAHLE